MLATATWHSLGTTARLVVHDGDLAVARRAVEALLERVDAACSRFRDDSELCRLNARAGQAVPVSRLLADAVASALRGAELTDGLVDPTVGRAMRLIGYDADFRAVAGRREPLDLRLEPIPGWRAIRLHPSVPSVRLEPGVELDLGSTGKALAADRAVASALEAMDGRGGVLVSLGGDIAFAGRAPAGGWQVLAAEDSATPTDGRGEIVSLAGGGIATSSTTVRRWVRGAAVFHHILDPRTGLPAAGPWRTVTVAAGTCVDANIAATAAIILGPDAVPWLTARGLPARLVSVDGRIRRAAGWPDPGPAAFPGGSRDVRESREPVTPPVGRQASAMRAAPGGAA
jgi:thiamine biosynthesis lipoprotein ApbE